MAERNAKAEALDSAALPLLWAGAPAGTAEAVREGLYLRFCVSVPAREDLRRQGTLLRVWLIGDGGEARLGTLEPSGGRLALSRRLSLRSLSPLGRLLRCEVRSASEDGVLSGTVEPPSGTVKPLSGIGEPPSCTVEPLPGTGEPPSAPEILPRPGGGVLLSYPAEGPFPLPELFCFARPDRMRGGERWVFAFDGRGRPVF